MNQLWKGVMHLNAKAFCLAAAFIFFGVMAWCGFRFLNPPSPLKDGGEGKLPDLSQPWAFGTLDFVSNQLAAETLSIPVDPFRPTIEAIFTNETERAAFLKALKAAQNAAAGVGTAPEGTKKEDPFAHLRKKNPESGGLTGADGQPMIIPKLTFMGFFQRPDGKKAAMFYDSANNSTVFYEAGKQVHGVDVLDANVREAQIRLPDGSVTTVAIGESKELAAEPDKNPPKKVAPAVKPGALAQQQKPGAKPGLQPKPGQLQKPVQKPLPPQQKPVKQPRPGAQKPRPEMP